MRNLFYAFLLLAITSCAKNNWNRNALTATCVKDMKDSEAPQIESLTDEQQRQICDCIGGKLVAKYKSKAEADKDRGQDAAASECTLEVLIPANPKDTIPQ